MNLIKWLTIAARSVSFVTSFASAIGVAIGVGGDGVDVTAAVVHDTSNDICRSGKTMKEKIITLILLMAETGNPSPTRLATITSKLLTHISKAKFPRLKLRSVVRVQTF